MPITSKKQYNYFQMMAHNPEKKYTKGKGPSREVAREFIEKTPAKKRKLFSK